MILASLEKFSSDIGFPYTMEGRLLGHVSMSAVMVQEAAGKAKVTGPKLQQLLHIVLSHHGEQEKGFAGCMCNERKLYCALC